jgi:hypothetical protein
MEPDKKPEDAAASTPSQAPQDALEKTNDELQESNPAPAPADGMGPDGKPLKKPNAFKQFLRRFNVYFLLFLLVAIIAAAVAVVSYLNSQKTPKTPDTATQGLTQDTLKQLTNSDATVGDTGQTLTVQGNAIFTGQVLIQKDLNVAGTINVGGPIKLADLTVSNSTNLNTVQANTLQVAQASTFQGVVTVQHGLNVAGGATIDNLTANQITVSKITVSGSGVLEIPNHISFTGASPGRQNIDFNALGNGGSASINGSDTSGTFNMHTGAGPTAGCYLTITFNRPFSGAPHVIISPVGSAAGSMDYYANNRTSTGFQLCSNNAPAANATFAFDYFVAN